MDKKNVLWFSRHQPTQAQLDECAKQGWNVVALDEGMRLGAMNIMDDGDVDAVGTALLALAQEHSAVAIIGVWTAPMQELLVRTAQDSFQMGWWCGVPCYSAWNVTRPVVNGSPRFEHRRFCSVGCLGVAALRWSK